MGSRAQVEELEMDTLRHLLQAEIYASCSKGDASQATVQNSYFLLGKNYPPKRLSFGSLPCNINSMKGGSSLLS